MQQNLGLLEKLLKENKITKATFENLSRRIRNEVFFGSDANSGVACAAKMNMIIAGDGHTNIQCEDSLSSAKNWTIATPDCDLILTNPPFGTSESDSLSVEEISNFPVRSLKGQHLFLQKMVLCTKRGGEICTVIDEGVLNTDTAAELRNWLLRKCKVKAVIRLPEETFKPNKINVRSSLLYLERWEQDDDDLEANYQIHFCDLHSLGYEGSGDIIRSFDFPRLLNEVESKWFKPSTSGMRKGDYWQVFQESVQVVIKDLSNRLDLKYWRPDVRARIDKLASDGAKPIKELNKIVTERGDSPAAESYVDEQDGYALVVKAGSNISKFGKLIEAGDYIEKNLYDEFVEKAKEGKGNGNVVMKGDVLLSSTGDGTMGKCCVYKSDKPAVADGHVTIIRVNPEEINPEYLCDYLRCGFGAVQIDRFYTGSTGMIELTPKDVARIVVDPLSGIPQQRRASAKLRKQELTFVQATSDAEKRLEIARSSFRA